MAREETGARLRRFPLKAPPACIIPPVAPSPPPLPPVASSLSTHPSRGLDAFDDANQACSVMYLHGCEQYLALATQLAKPTFDPRSLDLPSIGALVGFYHACLGFPVKQTWLDAAKAGVTATLLMASPLTLHVIAPTQMKPSWVT